MFQSGTLSWCALAHDPESIELKPEQVISAWIDLNLRADGDN